MAMATSRALLAPSRLSPHTSLPPTALHARQVAGDYCVFQLTPTTHHQGVCHPIDETKPPLSYLRSGRTIHRVASGACRWRSSTHALAKQPPPAPPASGYYVSRRPDGAATSDSSDQTSVFGEYQAIP